MMGVNPLRRLRESSRAWRLADRIPFELPVAFHVAAADFRQRIRSRRLLVVLAAIAYFGYLVNVGTVELFYGVSTDETLIQYSGEPTAAYVGLTAGVTGATILLITGYYILSGSIERDRRTDLDRIVASTPVGDRTYLLGKWASHLGLVVVLLSTLGAAAIVNHLVHGAGATDPVAILVPIFLLGVPIGGFVAGITLVFQSTDRLSGTIGNITYFFLATTILSGVAAASGVRSPAEVPLSVRMIDTVGLLAVYEMTFDALLEVAPTYQDGPMNFGMGSDSAEQATFYWTGGEWPAWLFANRLGLVALGIGLALAATLPYDRFPDSNSDNGSIGVSRFRAVIGRLRSLLPNLGTRTALGVLPGFGGASTDRKVDDREAGDRRTDYRRADDYGPEERSGYGLSLTPVTDRDAGGIGRLLAQELRLMVRGHPWWWYAGGIGIVAAGLAGSFPPEAIVSVAAIWPIFLLSSMGVRPFRHRITPFVISSRHPYGQLLAEWLAGAIVTAVFLVPTAGPALLAGGAAGTSALGVTIDGAIVLAAAIVFIPSVALAIGSWSASSRPFELGYLLLWYVGPLNAVVALDFAGATGETAGTVIPLAFGAIGLVAFAAAVLHRRRLV